MSNVSDKRYKNALTILALRESVLGYSERRFDRHGVTVLKVWDSVVTKLLEELRPDLPVNPEFPGEIRPLVIEADMRPWRKLSEKSLSVMFMRPGTNEDIACILVTKFGVAGWGCGDTGKVIHEAIRRTNDELASSPRGLFEFSADCSVRSNFTGKTAVVSVHDRSWDMIYDMRWQFNANLWLTDIAPHEQEATLAVGETYAGTPDTMAFFQPTTLPETLPE